MNLQRDWILRAVLRLAVKSKLAWTYMASTYRTHKATNWLSYNDKFPPWQGPAGGIMVIVSTKEIKTTRIPCMLFYSGTKHRTDIDYWRDQSLEGSRSDVGHQFECCAYVITSPTTSRRRSGRSVKEHYNRRGAVDKWLARWSRLRPNPEPGSSRCVFESKRRWMTPRFSMLQKREREYWRLAQLKKA